MHLLVVCTGNRCRSPLAEQLAAGWLTDAGTRGVTVGSAGTATASGEPMDPEVAGLLRGWGRDPADFASRSLSAGLVEDADWILVMTEEHRRRVLGLRPNALHRTFGLVEAARLLAVVPAADLPAGPEPAERARQLLQALRRARASAAGRALPRGDVPDPVGGSTTAHRAVAEVVAAALLPLIGEITGRRERPAVPPGSVLPEPTPS